LPAGTKPCTSHKARPTGEPGPAQNPNQGWHRKERCGQKSTECSRPVGYKRRVGCLPGPPVSPGLLLDQETYNTRGVHAGKKGRSPRGANMKTNTDRHKKVHSTFLRLSRWTWGRQHTKRKLCVAQKEMDLDKTKNNTPVTERDHEYGSGGPKQKRPKIGEVPTREISSSRPGSIKKGILACQSRSSSERWNIIAHARGRKTIAAIERGAMSQEKAETARLDVLLT